MDMIKRVFQGEIKGIDEKEMTLTAFVSTNARDRYDEVLDPKGVDISNYNKNPVVLWAHQYDMPPIGKALWTKRSEEGILSKVKFASTPFAQEIFNLYKEGFLKAFSVGFIPKDFTDGDGQKTPKRTYNKWEMLEYSAVPVPANPEALALAIQKGMISDVTKKEFKIGEFEDIVETKPKPGKDESKEDFMKRCIPMLIDEGKEKDQAIAICNQLFDEKQIVIPQKGFDELTAELKLANEKAIVFENENKELRFKIYLLTEAKKASEPEITADKLANLIAEGVGRVIREHQGKLN